MYVSWLEPSKAMMGAGRAVGDKFRSLLDAHACEGQHILFTSRNPL